MRAAHAAQLQLFQQSRRLLFWEMRYPLYFAFSVRGCPGHYGASTLSFGRKHQPQTHARLAPKVRPAAVAFTVNGERRRAGSMLKLRAATTTPGDAVGAGGPLPPAPPPHPRPLLPRSSLYPSDLAPALHCRSRHMHTCRAGPRRSRVASTTVSVCVSSVKRSFA